MLLELSLNELPRGKLRGIEPDRFRFRHRAICVICEICGLNRNSIPDER